MHSRGRTHRLSKAKLNRLEVRPQRAKAGGAIPSMVFGPRLAVRRRECCFPRLWPVNIPVRVKAREPLRLIRPLRKNGLTKATMDGLLSPRSVEKRVRVQNVRARKRYRRRARGDFLQRFVLHEGIQRPERGNRGAASAFQEQKPVSEGQNFVRAWLGALFYLGAALCCGAVSVRTPVDALRSLAGDQRPWKGSAGQPLGLRLPMS
jgi:hypothetical protein